VSEDEEKHQRWFYNRET